MRETPGHTVSAPPIPVTPTIAAGQPHQPAGPNSPTAVADELNHRLATLFLPDAGGVRAGRGATPCPPPHRHHEFVLFHEYFDGDTGRGCGASHQTGWTALVARCLEKRARRRASRGAAAS